MQFVCNYFLLFRSEILDENMLPEYETILYEQNMWPEYVTRRCNQNMWLQNVSYLKSVGGVVTRMWDPFNNLIAKKNQSIPQLLKIVQNLKNSPNDEEKKHKKTLIAVQGCGFLACRIRYTFSPDPEQVRKMFLKKKTMFK